MTLEISDEMKLEISDGLVIECPKCGYSWYKWYEKEKPYQQTAVVRVFDAKWFCTVCRHEWDADNSEFKPKGEEKR